MQPPPRLFALLLIPLLLALFISPWVVIVDAFVSLPSSSGSPSSSCLPLYARPILSSAERLTLNEPVLREIATKLDEAGLGKTHLVQDRSLGPGLHVSTQRKKGRAGGIVGEVSCRSAVVILNLIDESHKSFFASFGHVESALPL